MPRPPPRLAPVTTAIRSASMAHASPSRTMRQRDFGKTGARVPVVGIGTWQMEHDDATGAVAAIRAALDAGATHVDTAELYGDGRVEELVGEAIRGRRGEVYLVSKVRPENASR